MRKLHISIFMIGISLFFGAEAGTLTVTNSCSVQPTMAIVTLSEDITVKGCKAHTYPGHIINRNQSYTFTNLNDKCPRYRIAGFSNWARAAINSQTTFTNKFFGGCTCYKSGGCY